MTTIQDSHVRQRALDPTRSFIVQAPAGSGKTELLTQRYLILLSRAQKAPEEIIAITFTRKAAAEMRARVLQALEFAHEPEPNQNDYRHTTWSLAQAVVKQDAKLNWQLIRNPNRLRILTIDALSAFLCRQIPLLTQFGATPSICEQPAALYQLAAQRLLKDAFVNPNWKPHLEHLLLHLDNDASKCEKLFSELLNHRDQWLPHILYSHIHHHTLRETLENSLKNIALEKMHLAAITMPAHLKQTLLLLARHAGNYFVENQIDNNLAHCANWIWQSHPNLDDTPSWLALANLLLTKDGGLRKTVNIQTGFSPQDSNKSLMIATLNELSDFPEFIETLQAIQTIPPLLYNDTQWKTITALTTLLPLLAAQLTLIFQDKKQIDFIELNAAALKGLGDEDEPTDLSLYLDYQIQHLLIDEFQDTSVTHMHLLEKLIAGWEHDDGRTLFLVGDPMQSIYRFRNAEVGLFLRAQENGVGPIQLEPLTLTMNFRSQEKLVQWFNNTFSTVFPATADIPSGRVTYTHAIAARTAIENTCATFYPTADAEDEAQQIIEKIKWIKQNNPTDSIAILVRSRPQLSKIIPALQHASLDLQATDIDALSDRPEIRDLLILTCALHHRADRVAWLSILRAPWCGLTLSDLEILAQQAKNKTIWESILQIESTTLSEDGHSRILFIRHQLQYAFKKQTQLSLSAWIEGVWIGLHGHKCLTSQAEFDNTRAFFNLLETIEVDSFSIEALTEKCKTLFANTTKSSESAIHILTIHKSKGLEFDHVFLPGLHRKMSSDNQQLFQWAERINTFGSDDLILAPIKCIKYKTDPIYHYLKLLENEKQNHEITRLLYVAATRAKKSLHMLAEIKWNQKENKAKQPDKGSFLEKLFPVIETSITSAPLSKSIESAPIIQTTFSRLKSDYFSFNEETKADKKPIYIDIDPPAITPQVIGTVIHELFEGISIGRIKMDGINKTTLTSRLLSLNIAPNELPDCLDIITQCIQKTLQDTRGQWILSTAHQEAHSEWPLTIIHKNTPHQIIIDRSFIDEDGTRWIIDYKTAEPQHDEALEDFLTSERLKHQDKLDLYAKAIHQLENNPIKIGLYFPTVAAWVEWDFADK